MNTSLIWEDNKIFSMFCGVVSAVIYFIIKLRFKMVDKTSAPAFSIGHSKPGSKLSNDFVPGPGAYETKSMLGNSKVSRTGQSTQQRFKGYCNYIPGPGSYNPAASDHAPNALILSRSKEKQGLNVPGPGSYQPDYRKVAKSQSGFTIGHSDKIADLVGAAKKLPGPGNYQTNTSTVVKDHAFVIGHEKRSDMVLNKFVPGPGQYKQTNVEDVTLKHPPQMVFAKSKRSLSTSNLIPGPGSYAMKDNFADSIAKHKGFSISSKHWDQKSPQAKMPGPGTYSVEQLDKLKHKVLSFSVGKSAKLKLENEKELVARPGPEKYSYKLTTFDVKAPIFGKQKKNNPLKQSQLPGPGAYNPKERSTLPQFSIPKSGSTAKVSSSPGPGSYDPKLVEPSEYNSIKLSKDERKPFYNEKKGIPGPGSYESGSVTEKAPGFKIGKEKRPDIGNSKTPGPGNYSIPSTIANLSKFNH